MSNNKYIHRLEESIYDIIRAFKMYTKTYDGILFQSSSRKNLNALIDFYEEAKENAKGELTDDFFDKVEGLALIITDYDFVTSIDRNGNRKFTEANSDEAYYIQEENKVYIGSDFVQNKQYGTLYHELGHTIDFSEKFYEVGYYRVKKALEAYDPKALDSGKSVDSIELFACLIKFQKEYKECNKEIDKILESPEEQAKIEEKAKQDFKTMYKSTRYDSKTFEEFKKWTYGKYKDEILYKSGFAAVSDIFDALFLGQTRENPLLPGNSIAFEQSSSGAYSFTETKTNNFGHGSKYYSTSGDYRTTEIIANYSDLYNNGKVDLLYK